MLRSRTLREGTVGLFAILGLILIGGIAVWLRGGGFGQDSYELFVEFSDASGIKIGAPVRFRGVDVGKVVSLAPTSNGVGVTLGIASAQLPIPRQSKITTSRYGLLGEAAIDINPLTTLDEQALSLNPNAEDCDAKYPIFCHQDRIAGVSDGGFIASLAKLSDVYSDPAFVNNISQAVKSAALAGDRISILSDEMLLLSRTARQEIQGISKTVDVYGGVAQDASGLIRNLDSVIAQNQVSLNQIFANAVQLTDSLNAIATENRGTITATLVGIEQTSRDLQQVAIGLNHTIARVNQGLDSLNTQQLAKDLETLMANAAETSANLRDASQAINDPTLLLSLQKTLDSARVTLENFQKISSDLDELTGDPAFRENIRRLIDGLSTLMSSSQALEQQVYTSQWIDRFSSVLKYQVENQQQLARFSAIAPPQSPLMKSLLHRIPPSPQLAKPPIIKTDK
jgi:phospholipid/cholesterol/gamma-HCH transport system substrate-binding protein